MLTTTPEKIIGKILIAQNPVNLYRNNATSVRDFYTVVPVGKEIGKVVSSKVGANGVDIIYEFTDSANIPFFAFDTPGAFIVKKASTKTYIKFIAIAVGVYVIYRTITKKR
jgi:hypothetical protein